MMSVALCNVGISYGRTEVVSDLNFKASPGRVLALVGANGSGKSSILRAIAGLLRHTGEIAFAGSVAPPAIGYMPQSSQPCAGLTILEIVLLGRVTRLALRISDADIESASETLRQVGILELAGRSVDEVSGGQRQLAFLAQALASRPQILLLDEPVSALDLRNQLQVLELVKAITNSSTLTTIAVLHDLSAAARFADDVAMIGHGRLIAIGPPAAVLTPPNIAAAFRVRVETETSGSGALLINPLHAI